MESSWPGVYPFWHGSVLRPLDVYFDCLDISMFCLFILFANSLGFTMESRVSTSGCHPFERAETGLLISLSTCSWPEAPPVAGWGSPQNDHCHFHCLLPGKNTSAGSLSLSLSLAVYVCVWGVCDCVQVHETAGRWHQVLPSTALLTSSRWESLSKPGAWQLG